MDNTIVALFNESQEADFARIELLRAGFGENDVSIFHDVSGNEGKDMVSDFMTWLGKPSEPATASFLTLYTSRGQLERAEVIIERHHPMDVKRA